MSETLLIAFFSLTVGGLGAIAGLLWQHVAECRQKNELLGEIRAELARIKVDIGTHDSGLRGATHDHAFELSYFGGCVWLIAEKLGVELPPRGKRRE